MKAVTLWLRSADRICHLCLTVIERSKEATIDHLIPRSKGGREGWPNVGLAHKACNHRRGTTPIAPMRLLELVRRLTNNQNLTMSEVVALVYRPLEAKCDEFVPEMYSLCLRPATTIARYNHVEGWTPKCNEHIVLARLAGAETMYWNTVPREIQWQLATL